MAGRFEKNEAAVEGKETVTQAETPNMNAMGLQKKSDYLQER